MPVNREQIKEALEIASHIASVIAGIITVKYMFLGDPPSKVPRRELLGVLIEVREGLKAMRRALTRFDYEEFVKHYSKVKDELDKLVPDVKVEPLRPEEVKLKFKTMRMGFERTRMRPVGYYIIGGFITASLYPLLAGIIKSIRLREP